jgi:hypothetical protein
MFSGTGDLVFGLSQKLSRLYCMQEDAFMPNLVQIGRETAEKSWRGKEEKLKCKSTEKRAKTAIFSV